jgi:outer membrane protein assembly factor BamE
MRRLILLVLVLAGCKQVPMLPGITPHKIDIQQGNYVTQDMVSKLKPGMSKSQVRFALGTPLVVDPFHADRWDYVYVLQKGGRVVEQRRIVVVFQDEKLARIDGDVVPSATVAQPSAIETPKPATSPPTTAEAVATPRQPPPAGVAEPPAARPTESGEPVAPPADAAKPAP